MTWKEFIHYCGREIGRPEYWPVDGDVAVEQVDRAYSALISVLRYMPFQRLSSAYGTDSSVIALSGTPLSGDLPDGVMSTRDDLGIAYATVGSRFILMSNFTPEQSFFASVNNYFQEGNTMVCLSRDTSKLFVSEAGQGVNTLNLFHYKEPLKPTVVGVNGSSAEWPLNDFDSEVARQIVAMHASGVDANDTESLKLHQILSNFYGGNQ